MSHRVSDLSPEALEFLTEYHLGTLATLRSDGSPHVVAVGFTVDPESGIARVITRAGSQKATNAARRCRAVATNVDGPRWISFEGVARLASDASAVREGERLYAARYREPRPNPERVVVEIAVDRVLGSRSMFRSRDSGAPDSGGGDSRG